LILDTGSSMLARPPEAGKPWSPLAPPEAGKPLAGWMLEIWTVDFGLVES